MERTRISGFSRAPGPEPSFSKIPKTARARLASGEPSPRLDRPIVSVAREREIVALAIAELKKRHVDFGDLRLGHDVERFLRVENENVSLHYLRQSTGIGIRARVKGFWGFAATPDLTDQGIIRCVEQAVALAKGVASVTPSELGIQAHQWAEEPPHRAEFHTPVGICPFEASVEELATPFLEGARIGLGIAGIRRVFAYLMVYGRRRLFASTEGAEILTTHCITDGMQRFFAVKDGTSGYRTNLHTALAGGLEHVIEYDYPAKAEAAARDALAKCTAEKPASGEYTLILDPHNLALTMHESVGHPTELDRVLGYELSMAGGSFASLDKLRTFRYGSPIVNFTADNRILHGGASQGFDDEGVECQAFPIIREGILVGYGTSRETAHAIGERRANGTCRATSWYDAPIVRIPNLFLEPGKERLTLEELIADTKDGILMLGRDSFSIDQMRLNFQFGADMSYRIRNGKIAEPLRDVIYQSITPEFWGSCDAICDEREWRMHGVFNCGKGQPMQAAKMMHGASPARFRNIRVGY